MYWRKKKKKYLINTEFLNKKFKVMPSKLFSRARNDTWEAIFRNDSYRYVRKGYGLVVGIAINLFFFLGFSEILRSLWPHYLELGSSIIFLIIFIVYLFIFLSFFNTYNWNCWNSYFNILSYKCDYVVYLCD